MISNKELIDFLLKNRVDEDGDLNLVGLDFRGFKGNVDISGMKVKKNLDQNCQEVGGDLNQSRSRVGGDLNQISHTVGKDLDQRFQIVERNTYQDTLKEEENGIKF